VVPATRQITFVDNDAPRAEWVCDDCAHTYFPEHTHPCAICKTRPVNPDDGVLCDSCFAHYNSHGDDPCPTCPPFAEHTHPCPTCHHDRSCACTVFVPGEPLECATCSNCRGW
jgi:hypothetical protein